MNKLSVAPLFWGDSRKRVFMQNTANTKTLKMAQMAILIAIMLILAFTPLGYLKVGLIEITLMVIPVAVGAIVLGPACGAILGGVFGITSFIQCFGLSAFGAFVLAINPWLTLITCLVPRILCGWLSGLIFQALKKIDKTKVVSYFVASLSTALLNTIFFMGCIILFFWNDSSFLAGMTESGMPVDSLWAFLVAFVGLNGLVEAIVNFIVGAGIAKAVDRYVNKVK